jgi:hypothetical protein
VSSPGRQFVAPVLMTTGFVVLAAALIVSGIVDFTQSEAQSVYDPNPLAGAFTPLLIATVIFGLATYKTWTGRLFAGGRWERIEEQLVAAGFRRAGNQEVDQTARLPALILSPSVLRLDEGASIDHVMIGTLGGREVRSLRARIRGGNRWIDVPVVAVRAPNHLPRTIIRPGGRGLRPPTRMKQVTFELERFNRAFEVHSVDSFFTTALIDPRMMEWLEANLRHIVIELVDGWVAAWSNSLRGSAVSPVHLLEFLAAFNDRVPRVIPSFFPQRSLGTEWRHRRPHPSLSAWLDRASRGPRSSGG